jgi:transcriptional regulator with XRE-family HTH domain
MSITGDQMKKARKLLSWSQFDLGLRANVSGSTISDYEAGKRAPIDPTAEDLRRALEAGGIHFARKAASKEAKMTITGAQTREARRLLGWALMRLGGKVGVSEKTIAVFERGIRAPPSLDLSRLRSALESAGVIFVEEDGEGPGVRLRKGNL